MDSNKRPEDDLRKQFNWKVALASGVILGAGFGAASIVQADQGTVLPPEVIELRTERQYPLESDFAFPTFGVTTSAQTPGASASGPRSSPGFSAAERAGIPYSPTYKKTMRLAEKPASQVRPQVSSGDFSPASPGSSTRSASPASVYSVDSPSTPANATPYSSPVTPPADEEIASPDSPASADPINSPPPPASVDSVDSPASPASAGSPGSIDS